ncbi:MAG: PAS domain S-box protein, partial [Bacteroidota bacterium]
MQEQHNTDKQLSPSQLMHQVSRVEAEHHNLSQLLEKLVSFCLDADQEKLTDSTRAGTETTSNTILNELLQTAKNLQQDIASRDEALLKAMKDAAEWANSALDQGNSYNEQVGEKGLVEKELTQTNRLLQAINFIQTQYIDGENTQTVFDNILQKLLEVTESGYGFVGKIVYPPQADPFLKCYSITNIAWNEETKAFYEKNAAQGLEFKNLHTLFGQVITTGKPVIANAPATDPRRGGLPPNHPALNAFLGIPLYAGEKLIGMLGMANRPSGYDADLINFLEPLLHSCSAIIQAVENMAERKRIEKDLRASETRLAKTEAVSLIMAAYISLEGKWLKTPPSLCQLVGYTEEELLLQHFQDITHPDDIEAEENQYQRLLNGEIKSFDLEKRCIHRHGNMVWIYINSSLVLDENDAPVHFLTYLRDITPAKLANEKIKSLLEETQSINEELSESQEELLQILETTLGLKEEIAQKEASLVEAQRLANMGSWEINIKLNQFTGSEQFYRIYGLNSLKKGMSLDTFFSFVHPADIVQTKAVYTQIREDGEPCAWTFRLIRTDGKERIINAIAEAVRDEQGNIYKLIGTNQDITESTQMEQALMESERRFQAIATNMPGIVYQFILYSNGKTTFSYVSAGSIDIYELTPEEIMDDDSLVVKMLHPDDLAEFNHSRLVSAKTLKDWSWEGRLRLPSGKQKWIRAMAKPLMTDNGNHVWNGMVFDITPQKLVEEEMKKSRLFLQSIVDNLPVAVFVKDARNQSFGQIYLWNKTSEHLFGLTIDQVQGKTVFELFPPDQATFFHQKDVETFEKGVVEDIPEEPVDSHTLGRRLLRTIKVPIFSEQNEPQFLLGISEDITQRKEAEILLREQNDELKKINTELDRFVYRASHDLRAPLVSMLGLINITRLEPGETQREEYFQLMTKSIHKLDIFIQDIINYSKNTRLEIITAKIDFTSLLSETLEELKYTEGNEDIEKIVDMEEKADFYSDTFRLNVIFNNIISNAIRYRNPRAKSFLHTTIRVTANKVVIEFKDNGQGIATSNLSRIFDMFYRASANNVGSGLGLYIVKEMIETLDGVIQVESTLGEGTTFRIELPNLRPA